MPTDLLIDELEPEPDNTPVEVAAFGWIEEAQLAEGLLRSLSIPCFIKNENVLRIDPRMWMLEGGLSLMVAACDVERAREILATRVSDDDLAAQAEAATPSWW
jgi:hypothetical protein